MDLKGKRVLVVGLGKSGLAAALFLRRQGAQVTVSDVRSAEALAKELPALLEEGIAVEAGGHGMLTFRRQDLIVVSPGVPLDTPELEQVRTFGLPVIGELELASRYLKGKTLAITGSNGKTTTTSLCGEILKAAGFATEVGGNIGVPVIALVEQSRNDGWTVLEVSSFQLESTEQFHPEIAVILNITPDHLDRHGTFENYAMAKERIFLSQTSADSLVLNADDPRTVQAASRTKAKVFWFSRNNPVEMGAYIEDDHIVFRKSKDEKAEPLLPLSEIALKGAHNIENVLAAVCATQACRREPTSDSLSRGRFQGCRASPGVCGEDQWRRLLQRLEGHKCGCDHKGNRIVCRQRSFDPGRQRQELGLQSFEPTFAPACEGRLHHRIGRAENRDATSRHRADHFGLYVEAGCNACGGGFHARRRGIACSGVLQLRSVR